VLSQVPIQKVTAVSIPAKNISVGRREGDLHVASWGWLAALPRNGQTVTHLSYEAVGLPGIVRYRAERDVPVHEAGPGELDDDPKPLSFETSDSNLVVGKTIGVVAFPADRTPAGLLAWLRGQLREACGLGWIDDANVCRSLETKLMSEGLGALPKELDAERGKHVNETAHTLLTAAVASLVLRTGR
jgi:hypothetical protein